MQFILKAKSKKFAVRIVRLYKFLTEEKREYILSKQILRSGTSIGANYREASKAQSTADFVSKLYISLKEAEETCYWLELLNETEYIDNKAFESIYAEADELVRLLTSIIKTTKENNNIT